MGKHKARPLSISFGRKRGVRMSPSIEQVEDDEAEEKEAEFAPVERARPGMGVKLNSVKILNARKLRDTEVRRAQAIHINKIDSID